MNKLKIFISSRSNKQFINLDTALALSDLRIFIREQLEKEFFLGEQILEITINENSFKGDFTEDAFNKCLSKMRSCNIIIIFYNGEAGWDVGANGICHDEFLLAVEEFPGMTYALDLTNYFTLPKSGKEVANNTRFQKEANDFFRHMESFKDSTVQGLKQNVLKQIKGYIINAIEKSLATRKQVDSASTEFGPTLNWSKLTYAERQKSMNEKLKQVFKAFQPFEDIILTYHGIPDNMSVAEARNLIGRPFLYEHTLLDEFEKDKGAIHIVTVYGNATEMQVKNLVGYPDLAVIKGRFGYYLWEKTSHIQIFFITKCVNPSAIGKGVDQLAQWLRTSREQEKIAARAKARYSILKAIRKSQETTGIS